MDSRLTILEDRQLLQELRDGSEKAFRSIYDRYWEPLYKKANVRLASSESAQEIVQDIFLSLWDKREVLTINTSLSAYLSSALKYKIMDFIRSKYVRARFEKEFIKIITSSEDTTNNDLNLKELTQLIEEAQNDLPEKCKQVFELSRNQNYSLKEISVQLNISTNTVENHLYKALKIIKMKVRYMVIFIINFYFVFIGK